MKIASIIGCLVALALIIVNITKISFEKPLEDDSTVALIGVVSGLIVIIILLIFNISKIIEKKSKQ
ncbi:hypothetical protein [Pseudofulvibacter geojedonensis]|uniref:Uncharacterized protein n=1 Tax=Pseudofulvibacter geojedonensis TaxID=1123758 RepID=A0ABW3I4H0_9FLAO